MAVLQSALSQMWFRSDGLTKRFVIAALFLMLGSSLAAALSPLALKTLVDTLDPDGGQTINLAPVFLVVAYVSAHCLSRSLAELQRLLLSRGDQRINRQLSDDCFRHVLSLPLRFHLERETGGLSQTLANGLVGYRVVLLHLVNSALPIVVEAASMGAVLMFLGHGGFLVLIGVSVLLYAFVFWFGATRIRNPAQEASAAHIHASAVFTDSLLNYETVKCFSCETLVRRRFMTALRNTETCWAELYKRKSQNGLAVAAVFTLSLGLSLLVAASAVRRGTMSIGEFVLVNAYVIQLVLPLERIGFAFRDIVQALGFIEKLEALSREKPEPRPTWNITPPDTRRGELVFENVSFGYDEDRLVLHDLNIVVPPGHTLGVVGASGSGKSSLIRLLLRLLEPSSGKIRLGGTNLSDYPLADLRNRIAVVPQDPILFNDSIAFNIAVASPKSEQEEIVAAARTADVHDFIAKLPEGYDTRVGERGVRLSGGERQRLAIARAAVRKPEIFVFDEATSALDARTERRVLRKLFHHAKNATTIILAHRLSTVTCASEIIVLDNGQVVERGTHEYLLATGGEYSAMWRSQQANAPVSAFARESLSDK